MKIVTCSQMRKMEKSAIDSGISSLRLMENAGSAAARFIRETLPVSGKKASILCGKGNNGGDGFVVARKLLELNARVTVILTSGMPGTDESQDTFEKLGNLNPTVIDAAQTERCADVLLKSDIIVDAVFGTGFHGAVNGQKLSALFDAVNRSGAKVFSLDMPSGASAETGKVDGNCIRADYTVTFGAPKQGQLEFPAADFCGSLVVVGIGMPESAYNAVGLNVELLDGKMVQDMIPVRAKNSNKGNFGKVFCLCGSLGMAGAAFFAACGALRCGAGIVTLGVPAPVYEPTAAKLNECLIYPFDATGSGSFSYSNLENIMKMAEKSTALLIGCGLSMNAETQRLVRDLISKVKGTVILDADGINAFEGHIDLLRTSKAELVLTPHPGEMSRICGKSVSEIQQKRLETARNFAKENGLTLVLKGANTVVAAKDGSAFVNPTGNPGMARGGSGDVLAGMTAAFAAQGFSPENAASCAVFIHGLAGDRCAEKLSQYGMLPSDMLLEIPQIFREMSR